VTLKIETVPRASRLSGTFDPRIWIKSKLRLSAAGPRRVLDLKRWPLSDLDGVQFLTDARRTASQC